MTGMNSDERLAEVLRVVASTAEVTGLRWVLVGAAARDLVLAGLGLERLERATIDVDIAVQVRTWVEFERLKSALIEAEGFVGHSLPHRLISPAGQPLDIVPFGKIAASGELVWRGTDGVTMDVALFDDVLARSSAVVIEGLTIRIPSLACIISMKLCAWRDRHDDTSRDAIDLVGLLERAKGWPNHDRLYDEQPAALERYSHDLDLTCVHLLGVQIAQELSDSNRMDVLAIVEEALRETAPSTLLRDLRALSRSVDVLKALLSGMRESD